MTQYPSRADILKQALDTYGTESQLNMMIEEMSELTKAICKYYRCVNSVHIDEEEWAEAMEHIKEEMADVRIMLNQLALIFGDAADYEAQKLVRLAKRLGMLS